MYVLKTYKKDIKDIEKIKELGKTLAKILKELEKEIKVGVNTWDLEKKFLKLCKKYNVNPSCKGYGLYGMEPFPCGLCISINEESVHCYPKKNKILKDGDIVTVDTDIERDGWYVDSAFSCGVGNISQKRKKLLETSLRALNEAIKQVKPGVKIGVISNTIQTIVEKNGFDVLRDYAGHGIGRNMHEDPEIPCFGDKNEGAIIKEGMLLAIETLTCEGNPKLKYLSSWETKMADNKDFVSFEHTVLVTKNGYEIITDRSNI